MEKNQGQVLRLSDFDCRALRALLQRFGLRLEIGPENAPIEGSYWGGAEAGLVDQRMLARNDTPVHSVLHEACHYICMDAMRRQNLHTDASGDYDEENAVCYLQIVLADALPGIDRERMFRDMDAWGYSFRLGSAKSWYEHDALDAKQWLIQNGIICSLGLPTYCLRKD
jgi:hypothetical protein